VEEHIFFQVLWRRRKSRMMPEDFRGRVEKPARTKELDTAFLFDGKRICRFVCVKTIKWCC
jgi:hypothetical protein